MLSKYGKPAIILAIVLGGLVLRLSYFEHAGGDHTTFKLAVNTLLRGENPYEYTVQSFDDRTLKKGYAYLPSLMYLQTSLAKVNQWLDANWPTKYIWKVPVILADLAIVYILVKLLYKESFWYACLAATFWMFNPHILARKEYTLYDPLATVFLLLSFITNTKKSWLQGLYFAIAVSFKAFPIILLPLLFLKTKKKLQFLLSGGMFGLLISLPFLHDLKTYISATILVHGERKIQGRPLLTFISIYLRQYGINFYQNLYYKVYSKLAIVLPWIGGIYLYLKKKELSLFQLAVAPIGLYYLITPVMNRTHILWFIPIILIGIYEFFKANRGLLYGTALGLFILLFGYLKIWDRGFIIYDCMLLTNTATEKAASSTCNKIDIYGISHCPTTLGKCIPHCCKK